MRCNDCMYFKKIEWVGANARVVCHHPFFVPNDKIDPEIGCAFGNRAPKNKTEDKEDLQGGLF